MKVSHTQKDRTSNPDSTELAESVESLMDLVTSLRTTEVDELPSFEEVEKRVRDALGRIGRAASAVSLSAYEDEERELVVVNSKSYRRLNQASQGRYIGLDGTFKVQRSLYREVGVHNGPTIVPLELRAGIVEGNLTPLAARAVARLIQAVPSREAYSICKELMVLPVSRSFLESKGKALGCQWEYHHEDGENALIDVLEIPTHTSSVSVAVDRVSVPMEEPRPRPEDLPPEKPPKNPIEVKYRMAYCGVLTLHDSKGVGLACIRYGRMSTKGAAIFLESSLMADLQGVLYARPDLKVVTLADGAPEMQNMLDRIVQDGHVEAQGIDFYHVVEKLAAAIKATDREVKSKLLKWKKMLKKRSTAVRQILVELRTWALDYEEDDIPKGLHEAITYLTNNGDRMQFAEHLAAGLPIASGYVEATCKTLVSMRLKRSGARWKHKGGQAILNLRSLATSDRWDPAMRFLLGTYRQAVSA